MREDIKDTAKRRIAIQDELNEKVKEAYLRAFRMAATATYASGLAPSYFEFKKSFLLDAEINVILDSLIADIYKLILQYSERVDKLAKLKNEVDSAQDQADYLPFVFRNIKGKNIEDRLQGYKEDSKYEFEAFLAASMLLKRPISFVIQDFSQYATTPYSSPTVKSVLSNKIPFLISAKMLLQKGIVYGQSGKYNSALNSLTRLTEGSIADAFGFGDLDYMKKNGAIGYIARRGSSYPCQICDDNTGFHPITEMTLPVHPRCMCYAVPVFAGDI